METITETRDARGYTTLHRAFETRSWRVVKEALDAGANPSSLTPSGASMEEFTKGIGCDHLFEKMRAYLAG